MLTEKPSAVMEKHVAAFLVHVALLEHGELQQRSCEDITWVVGHDDNRFLEDFSKVAMNLISRGVNGLRVDWRICDLVDGRLFLHILRRFDSVNLVVDVTHYGNAIKMLTGVDVLRHLPQHGSPSEGTNGSSDPFQSANVQQSHPSASVLPFSHPVLDPYLEDVELETDQDWNNHETDSKILQELAQWNSAKKTSESKQRTIGRSVDERALKRNQRFMADTVAYSASLTNASGKNINPERIVVQDVTSKKPQLWREQLSRQHASKAAKKETGKGKKNALEAAKDLQATKHESRTNAVIGFVSSQCEDFDQEGSLVKRYFKAHKYFSNLPQSDREAIGGEVSLYLCDILARMLGKPPLGDAGKHAQPMLNLRLIY